MKVSVIVPVKDDPPVFACVESLLACERGGHDVEFIVVDNGSGREFRERLGGLPHAVTVLDEPRPGQAAARNAGIRASSGEVVFFTDADCRVSPGWILRGLEGLEATGAELLRGRSGGIATTPASRAIEASFRWREKWVHGQPVNVDTKNLAVRRAVFEQVTFNEASLRAEDVEFGRVASSLGFRCLYWPEMRIDHEHEARLDVFLAKKVAGGWTGQRVLSELGEGRKRRGRGAASRLLRPRPGWLRIRLIRGAIWATVHAGPPVAAASRLLPTSLSGKLVRLLTLLALSLGNLLYLAGFPQPRFSAILSGRYPNPNEPRP